MSPIAHPDSSLRHLEANSLQLRSNFYIFALLKPLLMSFVCCNIFCGKVRFTAFYDILCSVWMVTTSAGKIFSVANLQLSTRVHLGTTVLYNYSNLTSTCNDFNRSVVLFVHDGRLLWVSCHTSWKLLEVSLPTLRLGFRYFAIRTLTVNRPISLVYFLSQFAKNILSFKSVGALSLALLTNIFLFALLNSKFDNYAFVYALLPDVMFQMLGIISLTVNNEEPNNNTSQDTTFGRISRRCLGCIMHLSQIHNVFQVIY